MYFNIDIPVRPEVLKFIAYRYPTSPFRLTTLNAYGTFLNFCIIRWNERSALADFEPDRKIYSALLKLRISERDFAQKGFFIHGRKKVDFNNYVLDMIEDAFITYVEDRHRMGMKLYKIMYAFRDKYGFTEDELSFKSMSKKYERHRKRMMAYKSA